MVPEDGCNHWIDGEYHDHVPLEPRWLVISSRQNQHNPQWLVYLLFPNIPTSHIVFYPDDTFYYFLVPLILESIPPKGDGFHVFKDTSDYKNLTWLVEDVSLFVLCHGAFDANRLHQ